jgi:hypothetical protein
MPFSYFLSLCKILGGGQEESTTFSGKSLRRSLSALQVLRTDTLAKYIVPEQGQVNLPHKDYESQNLVQLVPKLTECCVS